MTGFYTMTYIHHDIQNKSSGNTLGLIIAIRKSISNLHIVFSQNAPTNVSCNIQESWSFIRIIKTVKEKMNLRFSIFTKATDWAKWITKAMFKVMLTNWLKLSFNLVNNSTPVVLWQFKILLPESHTNFQRLFLKIFKLFELRIFWSS